MQGLGTRIEQQWLLQLLSLLLQLLTLLLLLPQPAPRCVCHALVVHHVEGVDVDLRCLVQVMVTPVQAAMGRGVTRQLQPAKLTCEALSSFKVLVLQLQHMPHGRRR